MSKVGGWFFRRLSCKIPEILYYMLGKNLIYFAFIRYAFWPPGIPEDFILNDTTIFSIGVFALVAMLCWIRLVNFQRSNRAAAKLAAVRGAALLPARGNRNTADTELAAVRGASYKPKRLFNGEEFKVYSQIKRCLRGTRWRVYGQVHLSEIISTARGPGFRAINDRRVDFLIVDAGWPLLAVEYNGGGHYGFTPDSEQRARMSDAIKAAALASAGIGLLVLTEADLAQAGAKVWDHLASRLIQEHCA